MDRHDSEDVSSASSNDLMLDRKEEKKISAGGSRWGSMGVGSILAPNDMKRHEKTKSSTPVFS